MSKNRNGEIPATATGTSERQSPAPSGEEGTPTLTQISNQGDSQATEVGDGDDDDTTTSDQARSSLEVVSLSIAGTALAFKSDRSQEDGGGSGRAVSERAPSRKNGVPDDTLACPSPI